MPRAGLSGEVLTAAGAELADEVGFDLVTLSALARRFGVAVPSLYSHVSSTDDLRRRIALLSLQELAGRTADAVAGRSGHAALGALGEAYRGYAAEHPGRYAAARHPLDHATALESAGPRIAELTRAALRDYRLGPDDQSHAVRLLGSAVHGFVSLELAGAFDHSPPDPSTTWARLLDGLDVLFRSWEPQ